ncbi:hypothetical protein FQN53_005585 [Emmonsiellopsis sp. PD_33]|nr:hypothetical protein FQN53_005585 [Emmonsiellopsis sp. PD_33]
MSLEKEAVQHSLDGGGRAGEPRGAEREEERQDEEGSEDQEPHKRDSGKLTMEARIFIGVGAIIAGWEPFRPAERVFSGENKPPCPIPSQVIFILCSQIHAKRINKIATCEWTMARPLGLNLEIQQDRLGSSLGNPAKSVRRSPDPGFDSWPSIMSAPSGDRLSGNRLAAGYLRDGWPIVASLPAGRSWKGQIGGRQILA